MCFSFVGGSGCILCRKFKIKISVLILLLYKMSIVFKGSNFILLDHGDFVNRHYKIVSATGNITSYELTRNLFSIQNNNKKVNRKRNHSSDEVQDETLKVQEIYEIFLAELTPEVKVRVHSKYSILDISDVRSLSHKLFESTVFDHAGINGGNDSSIPLKCKVKDEYFLIPGNSKFLCGCVKEQCLKLDGNKYDILIADPPWWNKYIRRLKGANDKLSYSMMYNDDIAAIPVKNLLSQNCLIAVWCTNAPRIIEAVKNVIFPQWGVTYVTTWYWLKVTVDMQPLCPFRMRFKKQPYERLMLGRVGDVDIPDSQLIVSVPSALHSHKPPLLDLLTPYVKTKTPQTLELFARYLLPNTTSVGFEPLKWQHISLYEDVT